jgi:hypothetical protein
MSKAMKLLLALGIAVGVAACGAPEAETETELEPGAPATEEALPEEGDLEEPEVEGEVEAD